MPVDLEELERLMKVCDAFPAGIRTEVQIIYDRALRNAAPAMIAELKERREDEEWLKENEVTAYFDRDRIHIDLGTGDMVPSPSLHEAIREARKG